MGQSVVSGQSPGNGHWIDPAPVVSCPLTDSDRNCDQIDRNYDQIDCSSDRTDQETDHDCDRATFPGNGQYDWNCVMHPFAT